MIAFKISDDTAKLVCSRCARVKIIASGNVALQMTSARAVKIGRELGWRMAPRALCLQCVSGDLPQPLRKVFNFDFKVRRLNDPRANWIHGCRVCCDSVGEALRFLRVTWPREHWEIVPLGKSIADPMVSVATISKDVSSYRKQKHEP